MKRRPKDIGRAAENGVRDFLRVNGFPRAERRTQRGVRDAGDLTGTPGVCWEVKARKDSISDKDIADWLVETERERLNAGADIGVLVVRRAGVGEANAGRWWAVLTSRVVFVLTDPDAADPNNESPDVPVRMLLADAVRLLRWAGYGGPLDPEVPDGAS